MCICFDLEGSICYHIAVAQAVLPIFSLSNNQPIYGHNTHDKC